MKAAAYIVVTLKFKKEKNKWTAYCEELGTATFAHSLKEARKRLEEAVILHLNTLEEVGERERFFKKHNITLYPNKPRKNEISITGPFDPDTLASPYIYPIHKELLNL